MLETVNDCAIILGTYHLVMFSNYVTNFNVQFYAGYSYYILVALIMIFNLVKIAVEQALEVIHRRKLREKI